MPGFSWKWWWEKVFAEFESRDLFVFLGAVGMFVLIWSGKIEGEHFASIVAAIAGYALGRPNSRKGGGE